MTRSWTSPGLLLSPVDPKLRRFKIQTALSRKELLMRISPVQVLRALRIVRGRLLPLQEAKNLVLSLSLDPPIIRLDDTPSLSSPSPSTPRERAAQCKKTRSIKSHFWIIQSHSVPIFRMAIASGRMAVSFCPPPIRELEPSH